MIFVIDKPSGMTSHDVVSRIKRASSEKLKIGHTGTLDPMCTGVLPIVTGNDTKLSDLFDGDKEYVASLVFGKVTDTQDITGAVLEEKPSDFVTEDLVRTALEKFVGTQEQLPPMYSAVKVGGRKLYELAREGIEVERKTRTVTVYEAELLSVKDNEYSVRIACSKGTYIRTLIHDLGAALGCGACMTALRRVRANGFAVENAVSLEIAEKLAKEGRLSDISVMPEKCFSDLGKCILPESGYKFYLNGGVIGYSRLSDFDGGRSEILRAYSPNNTFEGLCIKCEDGVKAIWHEKV